MGCRDQAREKGEDTGLVVGIVWNFRFCFVCVWKERRIKKGGIQSKKE
jgi:hypothetical protein